MSSDNSDVAYWTKISAEIEALVVAGNHDKARARLEEISPRSTPREYAVTMAQLASRIHHSIYALKVLHRFVFPENKLAGGPTDSEKIAYGYALSNLGAVTEAMDLFDSVPAESAPEMLIQKAMAHFANWEYSAAVPLLKRFIENPALPEYRRTVGEVNLAAALVSTQNYDAAEILLTKLLEVCQTEGFQLLHGNCLELMAQLYFFQKDYDKSIALLEESLAQLKDQKGIYQFVAKKWLILCRAFQNPTVETLTSLKMLKAEAQHLNYFETAREMDLFQAVLGADEELLRKVIMGTPSAGYRQRIRTLFETQIRAKGSCELWLGSLPNAESEVPSQQPLLFDPGEKQKDGSALYEKPQLLSLFEALTLDFYKPAYIGALFKQIYPKEKFNPYSSPARVMQLLKRLDQWFIERDLPLRVHFKKSEFALMSPTPIRVLIQRGKKLSAEDAKWQEVKQSLGGRHFSVSQICKVLGISKTSAQRLIREGIAQGKLSAAGQGRAATYSFRFPKQK